MLTRLGIGLATFLASSTALAQQPYDSSYALEIHASPLLSTANITGLAGAFVSVAEGAGAQLLNPAAVANRYAYNGDIHFDWDFSVDFLGVGTFLGPVATDFDNNGRVRSNADNILIGAINFSWNVGRLGLGLGTLFANYSVCLDEARESCASADDRIDYMDGVIGLSAGYAWWEGQLITGGQLTIAGAELTVAGDEEGSPSLKEGFGFMAGVVYRPLGLPLRAGATFRSGVRVGLDLPAGSREVAGLIMPEELALPWQASLGLSWMFGERPYNFRHSFGDEEIAGESPEDYPRNYHLVSMDVVVVGPSDRAVGIDAWLAQELQRAGQAATFSVRAGYETEFWQNRMRARAGAYWEPSRFRGQAGRPHVTAGFDVRLFELEWQWRLTGGFDLARRYNNLFVSIGFWR